MQILCKKVLQIFFLYFHWDTVNWIIGTGLLSARMYIYGQVEFIIFMFTQSKFYWIFMLIYISF